MRFTLLSCVVLYPIKDLMKITITCLSVSTVLINAVATQSAPFIAQPYLNGLIKNNLNNGDFPYLKLTDANQYRLRYAQYNPNTYSCFQNTNKISRRYQNRPICSFQDNRFDTKTDRRSMFVAQYQISI